MNCIWIETRNNFLSGWAKCESNMALTAIQTTVAILVGVATLIGLAHSAWPRLAAVWKTPEHYRAIEGKLDDIRSGQREATEEIADTQAAVFAVAHRIENNSGTSIDLEKMDDSFVRGDARARDFIEEDEPLSGQD